MSQPARSTAPRARVGAGALLVALGISISGLHLDPAAGGTPALGRDVAPQASGTVVATSMYSPALRRKVAVSLYLPPGYSPRANRYPVLYLLHGLPGSGPSMLRSLDLFAQMNSLIDAGRVRPMLVVAPSDGPTAGTDTEWANSQVDRTARWGSFVVRDLVRWVDRSYRACPSRAARAIGGLSMGAFGAINDALHHPMEFAAVTLWSPYFVSNTPLVDGPVGSSSWRESSPLIYLPEIAARVRSSGLRISMYVGTGDEFYHQTAQFAEELARAGIPHRYAAYRGAHSYALWRSKLAGELTWVSSVTHC